jgi:hypothetical protein
MRMPVPLTFVLVGICMACMRMPTCSSQEPAAAADRSLPWVTAPVDAPRVSFRTFDSRTAAGKVSYHAYTPAAYDEPDDTRLPVLYWLHGTGGGGAGIRPLAEHFGDAIENLSAVVCAGSHPPSPRSASGEHRIAGVLAAGLGDVGDEHTLRSRNFAGSTRFTPREFSADEQFVRLGNGETAHRAPPLAR